MGACMLACALGAFAPHRARVCTVRAIAEVISSRTGHMLASIGKSAMWVIVVTSPVILLMPSAGASLTGWPLSGSAGLGGFIFGIGAAINGRCAVSTLAPPVYREAGMLCAATSLAFRTLVFST